jgi:hypothetical protein
LYQRSLLSFRTSPEGWVRILNTLSYLINKLNSLVLKSNHYQPINVYPSSVNIGTGAAVGPAFLTNYTYKENEHAGPVRIGKC